MVKLASQRFLGDVAAEGNRGSVNECEFHPNTAISLEDELSHRELVEVHVEQGIDDVSWVSVERSFHRLWSANLV